MSDKPASPLRALERLLRFARRHWQMALLQLVLAAIGTSLVIVFPAVVRGFVDDLIPRKDIAGIWRIGGLALGAFFLREFFSFLRIRLSSVFEQRLIFDLRDQLHRKIQRLPLGWFDRQKTGDVLTRLADDVPATQRVVIESIEQGLTSVLQILLCAGVMFYTHPTLTLLIMLPVPLIASGGWLFARWVTPRARQAREATSRLNEHLHDGLTGIRQIKSYTAEGTQQEAFRHISDRLRRAQLRQMGAWAVYSPLMGFLGSLGLVLLLSIGSLGVIRGWLTAGQLFQFIFLLGFFFEPIARLHGVNQTLVTGLASAERVFQILDEVSEEDLASGRRLERVQGALEFRAVHFAYTPDQPVLNGLSLRAEPRQTTAIVGVSGAGKSTLFQLLVRFYDPQSGDILLDGIPLSELNRISLRETLAYVTQDAFLFAGSIRDNLRLGRADADDAALWHALRLACAEDFVRQLTHGLDTEVGERGVLLSGGERQRIAMARAFLKDAPILLLDEATSAVDAKSEHFIQQALDTLRRDRTCLVIAHRLSTVMSADVIHVLRGGRIHASGSHQALLQTCPYYRELTQLTLS